MGRRDFGASAGWPAGDGFVSISKVKEGDTDINTLIMRFGPRCRLRLELSPIRPRFGSVQGLRPWTPAVMGVRIKGSASAPPGSRRCGSGRQQCP
jgi:hypothetical protein